MRLRKHAASAEVLASAERRAGRSRRPAAWPPTHVVARTFVDQSAIARLQGEAGNRAVLTLLGRGDAGTPKPAACGAGCRCAACAGDGTVQRASGATSGVVVQRRKPRVKAAGVKPKVTTGGGRLQVWVVRDRSIGLGGIVVRDLADFKSKVMGTTDADGWTLVLAIHGSEDRLGAQSPPDWQKNAVFYDATDVDALFAQDKAFVKWRDQFGPTDLSLVSCQVSAPFERVLIDNLTRPGDQGSRQPARGLGEGCKPLSTAFKLDDAPGTRRQYDKLSPTKQKSVLDQLDDLNQKWGYYGAPPVPRDLVMHDYYDEDPKGEWVTVEVHVDQGDHQLKATGIPYWNRTVGPDAAKFRKLCSQGIGKLKARQSKAPPAPDE